MVTANFTATSMQHGTVCAQAVPLGSVYCLPAGADMRHVVCRKTISFAAGLQPLAVAQHDEQDSIFRSRCVKQQAGNCQSLIVLCAETALPTTNCQLVHILLSSGCAATSGLCT